MSFPINLFLLVILPAALLLCLQVILSRRPARWPGLVLPALHLLLSIVIIVANVLFMVNPGQEISSSTDESVVEVDDGDAEASNVDASVGIIGGADGPTAIFVSSSLGDASWNGTATLPLVTLLFGLLNIPTLVELAIYAAFRNKRRSDNAVNKSRIRDL